jgi:hypothetical protein
MNSLATLGNSEIPTNFWLEPGKRNFIRRDADQRIQSPWIQAPPQHFVAALHNGTTTGVLKHRLMRLNSTVRCEDISASAFPSPCGGRNPFTTSLLQSGGLNARLCVPGQRGLYPWQNLRHRQDIIEDVYIDLSMSGTTALGVSSNFTRHCTVRSTRGYFEMGNYRNGLTYGSLLEQWEEPDPLAENSEYVSVFLPPTCSECKLTTTTLSDTTIGYQIFGETTITSRRRWLAMEEGIEDHLQSMYCYSNRGVTSNYGQTQTH